MLRSSRTLRRLGLALSATCLLAWGASLWVHAGCCSRLGWTVILDGGELRVIRFVGNPDAIDRLIMNEWSGGAVIRQSSTTMNWGSTWREHADALGLKIGSFRIHEPYASGNVAITGSLWLPLWMPMVVFVSLTIFASVRLRRSHAGRCVRCGYDLTGNESGVCPECGTTIQPTASKA